jgi:hypothetical protein
MSTIEVDSQSCNRLPPISLEETPVTGPLSDGPDSMTVPQILESTQSELSHDFLSTGSEPRERPALSKRLSPLKQNFPTSYEGSNSEAHSQARVEKRASYSPAIQGVSNHIACADNAHPVEEAKRSAITFLLDANVQRVNSSAMGPLAESQDSWHLTNSPRDQVEAIRDRPGRTCPSSPSSPEIYSQVSYSVAISAQTDFATALPSKHINWPTQMLDVEENPRRIDVQRHRVEEQLDHSLIIQRNYWNPSGSAIVPSKHPCLALTDDQCRKIQDIVDPDGTRAQKSWELNSQPELIRLYMDGMSFPQIESAMKQLGWS